jgi:hypothetical protein
VLLQGSSNKYIDYSPITGISKDIGQSTLAIYSKYRSVIEDIPSEGSCSHEFLEALRTLWHDIEQFGLEREWTGVYTRRNLIFCLAGEVGELSEKLQFIEDRQSQLEASVVDSIGQEIADITIYFARFLHTSDFTMMDVAESISASRA